MLGLGKIQEAQKKMEEVKARLETLVVTGSAGGIVSVEMTAAKKIKAISIDLPSLNEEDRAKLESAILAAVSDAFNQADSVSKSEMEAAARDMLPGMEGMLGNLFNK